MKFLILSVCVAMVVADLSHILPKQGEDESQAMIVKQELDVGVKGRYQRGIDTEIKAGDDGSLTHIREEDAVQGPKWIAPEGELLEVFKKEY